MKTVPAISFLLAISLCATAEAGRTVKIRFDAAARQEAVTGRVYVAFARSERRPPISQAGPTGAPLYGRDVFALAAGRFAVIDEETFGHPIESLRDVPAGTYRAQAFINVYTRFPRADGHVILAHMDQWEGQSWRRSPGNLFSEPIEVTLTDSGDDVIELTCDQVIPPRPFPEDTEHVKRFRIESKLLTEFWGHPIQIGATVLLPKGYAEHEDVRYPVCYSQGHFSTRAPGGFGRGRSFDRFWLADDTPRFALVTFQHPTPYYDDSYAVNSENNGPYGDALVKELIPEIERRYRVIAEPWARMLSGGSTGGWEALALQIFYPDYFNGCWASCPDPVDFRYHQIVDIYGDDNAYFLDMGFTRVERPNLRRTDGNITQMMKDENRYELVVGTRSRSGGQWDIWEATCGPVGDDGYPRRLWDKYSGDIDHEVAEFWRKNYDLRHILETGWDELGPRLTGKLHVYVGDMDSFYLNNGVKLLESFLESTTNPPYGGVVEYGDGEPHCWGPSTSELIELMTKRIEVSAPETADLSLWRY